MFRKILSVIFAIFMFLPNAHSAEMVNVEYIHQYLNARWGIDLPYGPELTNPRVAANMKYLLTVVDIANEFLNNEQTTDYGNGEYATLAAADTVATNTAIDTLINAPTFTITTTPDTSSFSMIIGAAGNFIIDWGDGEFETIKDKPIGTTTYTHSYNSSGEYEIKLTGRATDYSDAMDAGAGLVPTFALSDAISGSFVATNVAKISGGLGRVFPTMDDGSNPNFIGTFMMAPITEIPADLFAGIHGAPAAGMFFGTFAYTAITSIPANLFGTLNGDGAPMMFYQTFSECPNLTTVDGPLFSGTITPAEGMFYGTFVGTAITEIPADLFAGIQGAPAESMFSGTFSDTAITEIPADLFAGIQGAPAKEMFNGTFYNTAITEIPADLFAGIQGAPAESMFARTFYGTAITSIPANLFGTLNGDGAPSTFEQTFSGCENLTTIDGPLFSGTLTPAERMFYKTFYNTAITEIPANLFGTLNGDGAPSMFEQTFYICENLTTIDGPLFSGTITPAERMFYWTFYNTAITEIPADFFAGIHGAPAKEMFFGTFYGTEPTEIPADLFAGIRGAPAERMFYWTFAITAITSIPENLFAGIQGAPAKEMFNGTFYNTAITEIPADLFAGIHGAPAERMFFRTFFSTDITSIPENLFAGIQGAPAGYMFGETFRECPQLQSIPENLFAGISGAPAESMFASAFYNCTQLQSIPENLFAGISGPAASSMFSNTFRNCTSLTGPSARTNGQYLYEIWPDADDMNTYTGSTGLSDYDQIPRNWK